MTPLFLAVCPLVMAGCDVDDAVTGEIDPPAEVAGDFRLELDEVDRSDRVFEVEVYGAPPGARLVLAVTDGDGEPGICPEDLEPTCLSIRGELALERRAVADEDGEAWWYVPFGAAGPDRELEVQAYTADDPTWMSNGLRLRRP